MKKTSIIALVLCIVALSVWFACNPMVQSEKTSFDVLDDSNSARITISCTIDVNGSTYDCGGAAVTQASGNPLGDGSQQESQSPFFRVTNGTVRNGSITPPAAD
jgi:hypothetical protein